MGTPVCKIIFDWRHRASNTKEGAIELRITYNRIQKHATTGVRVLPKQWKNGFIVNRPDALELQHTLDIFVSNARKVVNEQMEAGTLDMQTIVSVIGSKEKEQSTANVPKQRLLVDFLGWRGRDARSRIVFTVRGVQLLSSGGSGRRWRGRWRR